MEEYRDFDLRGTFFMQNGLFFLYIPVFVPYEELARRAKRRGYRLKDNGTTSGGILESAVSFGNGWIGIEVEDGATGENIKRIDERYTSLMHRGSFRSLRDSYKKLMKDFPKAHNLLNLYLDDPKTTPEADRRTLILFKK